MKIMLEKLKSRKLIMAIAGLLVILATELFGANAAQAASISDSVVNLIMVYIIGQGAVDAVGALKK